MSRFHQPSIKTETKNQRVRNINKNQQSPNWKTETFADFEDIVSALFLLLWKHTYNNDLL